MASTGRGLSTCSCSHSLITSRRFETQSSLRPLRLSPPMERSTRLVLSVYSRLPHGCAWAPDRPIARVVVRTRRGRIIALGTHNALSMLDDRLREIDAAAHRIRALARAVVGRAERRSVMYAARDDVGQVRAGLESSMQRPTRSWSGEGLLFGARNCRRSPACPSKQIKTWRRPSAADPPVLAVPGAPGPSAHRIIAKADMIATYLRPSVRFALATVRPRHARPPARGTI